MMTKQCPQCHQPQTAADSRTCEFCQAELIDNGLLADSLNVWGNNTVLSPWQRLLPLAITAISGVLTAYVHNSVFLFVGIIAAAACFYVMKNRRQ